MMTFAQALARIEELLKYKNRSIQHDRELFETLRDHADSIVQLGKVAQEMRDSMKIRTFDEDIDLQEPWIEVHLQDEDLAIAGAQAYDALMKKGGT